MALNDKNLLNNAQGAGVYPGMANPTSSSMPNDPMETNFVNDPTTDDKGAGAGPNFEGHKQAQRLFKEQAGVVEGAPGIIESTNVHPLRPDSNDDDGWAHATKQPNAGSTDSPNEQSFATQAMNKASGGAKMAYGYATGNKEVHKQGSDEYYGQQ